VYICDECIDLCNEIIDEELTTPAQLDLDNLPRPRDIYAVLNDYVVSQEEAKRTLAVRSTTTTSASRWGPTTARSSSRKSNILLLGPTGCGKTLLAQTSPGSSTFPSRSPTRRALTEAGYVGEDVENILLKLIRPRTSTSRRPRPGSSTSTRSTRSPRRRTTRRSRATCRGRASSRPAQDPGGTVASVPPRGAEAPHQEFLSIDTTKHPFHLRRRVAGLDKIIGRRVGKNAVGFGADVRSKNSAEVVRDASPASCRRISSTSG